MNIEMNGKRISKVFFPNGETISAEGNKEIVFSARYVGDRDEFWILQVNEGKEICRHNARYVETIIWEQDN